MSHSWWQRYDVHRRLFPFPSRRILNRKYFDRKESKNERSGEDNRWTMEHIFIYTQNATRYVSTDINSCTIHNANLFINLVVGRCSGVPQTYLSIHDGQSLIQFSLDDCIILFSSADCLYDLSSSLFPTLKRKNPREMPQNPLENPSETIPRQN